MITKERLEKLINKEASVWVISEDDEVFLYKFSKTECIGMLIWYKDYACVSIWPETCFETKEDAEFALKYQNIQRTDHLNLPTYEEFIKDYRTLGENLILDEKCVMFNCKTNVYSLYAADEEIWIGREIDGVALFHEDLNKENYIKACELCRKLFLGEG